MPKRAVCLISGGLDSCTTAAIAKYDGYDIYALSFLYGQRHIREIESAKAVAETVGAIEHQFIEIDLGSLGGSALTDDSIEVPDAGRGMDEKSREIPITYVPARNTIFLSYALAYAEVVDADAIFIGATAVDYSGYPDCRPEYYEAFQILANLATKRAVEGDPVEIKTPLIDLSKAEIIQKAKELGAPLEKTWSCYRGGKKACGKCESCVLRLRGFAEAGYEDPIEYEDDADDDHAVKPPAACGFGNKEKKVN